ncbi:MAG TPA: ArsR family transcriptional regulator [Bacteroidetes bacterium]|nr:ArsR family transcriptional regulator [Bacteroidota bacterium]
MAQKNDSFDAGDVNLANLAKAFSHPARISILRTLAEKNMCICGEVVEVLPLAQSTVSQHLKELKKVGLVIGEIEGSKSCYCINWDKINEFSDWIRNLFDELHEKKCC